MDDNKTTIEPNNEPQEPAAFTQDDVDKLVKEAQEKAAAEALEQYKKEQAEKDKLSKLSEKDRLSKELEKQLEENKRLAEIIQRNDLSTQARNELAKDGYTVSDEVLGLIVGKDEETTLTNMKHLTECFDSLRTAWEAEYSKGTTPKYSQEAKEVDPFAKIIEGI